jgi:hypothetical protein
MSVGSHGNVRIPGTADVQRSAYRTLNEDGIVDISLGLSLVAAALYVGLNHLAGSHMTSWVGLTPIYVMLIARGLRKRFVYPRIGYARVRNASPAILLAALMGILLVAGLVVMTIYARRGVRPPAELIPWLFRCFALGGVVVLVMMGRRTGLVRFYFHAGVVLLAVLVSIAVPERHYVVVLILGLPGFELLVTGVTCFVRFLQRHPKPESAHANP